MTWHEGRVRRVAAYTDLDEARAAAERVAAEWGLAVSQTNLEKVRGFPERWNAGERTIRPEEVDPDVEVESLVSSVAGRPYRGYAGLEKWIRDLDDQFAEWQIRHDDVREVGSAVVAIGGVSLRGRASDVAFDQPMSWVYDFGTEGRLTRLRVFLDPNAALKAVGLKD